MPDNSVTSPLLPFDAVRYLTDDAAIAEYLTAVLEEGTPRLIALALADVARAKGVALGPSGMPCKPTHLPPLKRFGT